MKLFLRIVPAALLICFIATRLEAQSTYNKTGGIAFRVDDHQTASKWRDFNNIFKKYGYHYSLGIDIQRVTFDTASYNALMEVVAAGNELMDHTPYGTTCYLWVYNLKDTMNFYNHPAIDHINKNRICLKYDSVLTGSVTGEGLVDLIGSKLISRDAGEFKNMYSPAYYSNIYLPSKNLLCAWYNLENKNQLDPDTLSLRSYWQETFNNDTALGIPHHRLSGYDIKMTDAAQNLLCERALYLYDSLGFPRPYTWVQPGGSFTQFSASEVKAKMGQKYGYTAAATYVAPSFKMYNEVDTLKIKRYALQNPDFSDESNYFQAMINTIADNSARHLNSFTLGHFVNPVGGWDAYLGRIDSLLAWCKANQVPVRTVNQWASIMFDSVPNPFANAIPELYRDLNKNNLPDGYAAPFGTFDSTDGVAKSKGRCITRTSSGSYFGVNIMGGVEKGWNRISVYTKGMPGDSVRISISLPEITGSNKFYNLASNTTEWKEVSTLIYIDPRASRVTLQFNALKSGPAGAMKISGMQLRKQSFIRLDKSFKLKSVANKPFTSLTSQSYVNDSAYLPSEYKLKLASTPAQLNIKLDTNTNIITAIKPSIFWKGIDSVKVVATNADKTSDSAYIRFESAQPVICIGDSFYIDADASLGSNFSWDGHPSVTGFWAKPISNTWYYLNYKNKANVQSRDSLQLIVNTVKPQIDLANDFIVCLGSDKTLNITNAGSINWYNEAGIKIQSGSSITLTNPHNDVELYISNTINSCITWDTVYVHINPLRRFSYKSIEDSTTKNQQVTIKILSAMGLSATLLNTPINQFIFSNGDILFNPNLNFVGRDSARYHFTDGSCSHDTMWINVNVKNTLSVVASKMERDISIYPNPAYNMVYISRKSSEKINICITDMDGRMLNCTSSTGHLEAIDISELAPGLYCMHIYNESGSKRILLQKQ